MKKYKIADLVFTADMEDTLLHPSMSDFLCNDDDAPAFTVTTDTDAFTHAEAIKYIKDNADKQLILSNYMMVLKTSNGYRFYYHAQPKILCSDVDMEKNSAVIHLSTEEIELLEPGYGCADTSQLSFIDYIFYVLRDIFFTFAPLYNMLPVHSSTIIYNDKAYVFSARSGTGKTTHTNLWINNFGVEILDGDVTMLSVNDGNPLAFGMPWCGTSTKYLNKKVPLGGIIFLSQAKENAVSELNPLDATLSIMARSFAPSWTKEQSNLNCSLSEQISSKTLCLHLACLPNDEAAFKVKEYIDTH